MAWVGITESYFFPKVLLVLVLCPKLTAMCMWFIILSLFTNLLMIFRFPISRFVLLYQSYFSRTTWKIFPPLLLFSIICSLKEFNLNPIENNIYHCQRKENYGKNNRYIEEIWHSQRSFLWTIEVKINEILKVKN